MRKGSTSRRSSGPNFRPVHFQPFDYANDNRLIFTLSTRTLRIIFLAFSRSPAPEKTVPKRPNPTASPHIPLHHRRGPMQQQGPLTVAPGAPLHQRVRHPEKGRESFSTHRSRQLGVITSPMAMAGCSIVTTFCAAVSASTIADSSISVVAPEDLKRHRAPAMALFDFVSCSF